jgi:hypothetical protein
MVSAAQADRLLPCRLAAAFTRAIASPDPAVTAAADPPASHTLPIVLLCV